jgi:mannose-1-phosphate guanylyltransferase
VKVVIMAGGQGTRFWPWSIKGKPKQFLPLNSQNTMIQETYNRYKQCLSKEKIYVVTTEEYQGLVKKQLPQLPLEQIIVEPDQRDTAPCVALTAMYFLGKDDDEALVISPADQYISDTQKLKDILEFAENIAEDGKSIVTLGVKPTRPETGYGYIKASIDEADEFQRVYKVDRFIEKPSKEHAKRLITSENVFWNSGLTIWKPSTIAYYMSKLQPKLWDTLLSNKTILQEVYSTLPKISVDYAILENAEEVFMIPATFQWDDLGTWRSLERLNKEDDNKNIVIGNINAVSTNNSIIISHGKKAIVLGVSDLIIVLTEDGLLVCNKSNEQEIKTLINDWPDLE